MQTGDLLSPGEVAGIFAVHPKTVSRWSESGKIRSIRTLGGHRRYYRVDVEALIAARDVQVG